MSSTLTQGTAECNGAAGLEPARPTPVRTGSSDFRSNASAGPSGSGTTSGNGSSGPGSASLWSIGGVIITPVEIMEIRSPIKLIVKLVIPPFPRPVPATGATTGANEKDGNGDGIGHGKPFGIDKDWNKLPSFSPEFMPKLNMHVLYKDKDSDNGESQSQSSIVGKGKRGLITNLPNTKHEDTYRVFLYDEGKYGLVAQLEQIKPLKGRAEYKDNDTDIELEKILPRSFILKLVGLHPMESVGPLKMPSTKWSTSAMEFVQDWIKSGQTFADVICQYGDLACYGDIVIKDDPIPLSQHLIDQKFSYIIPDQVEKLLNVLPQYEGTPLLNFLPSGYLSMFNKVRMNKAVVAEVPFEKPVTVTDKTDMEMDEDVGVEDEEDDGGFEFFSDPNSDNTIFAKMQNAIINMLRN